MITIAQVAITSTVMNLSTTDFTDAWRIPSTSTTAVTSTSNITVSFNLNRIILVWLWMLFVLLCFSSLVGNVIILFAVGTSRRFRRPVNYMLGNLSVASMLIVFSTVFYYLQRQMKLMSYGPWICPPIPVLVRFMVPAEGFTVMCISLDRSVSARNPWHRETCYSAKQKIVLIWISAFLLELPHSLFWVYDPSQQSFFKCHNKKGLFGNPVPFIIYICIHSIGTYVVPSVLLIRDLVKLITLYKFLCRQRSEAMERNATRIRMLRWNPNRSRTSSSYIQNRKRLIRNALIFTSVFICIKLPVGLWYSMYQLPQQLLTPQLQHFVSSSKIYFMGVAFLHGLFYPLIIFVLSHELRLYIIYQNATSQRHLRGF